MSGFKTVQEVAMIWFGPWLIGKKARDSLVVTSTLMVLPFTHKGRRIKSSFWRITRTWIEKPQGYSGGDILWSILKSSFGDERIFFFSLNMYQYQLIMILVKYLSHNLFKPWEMVGHGLYMKKQGPPLKPLQFSGVILISCSLSSIYL